MTEMNEETRREPGDPGTANNRWFVLGLAFLVLNAWAVLRDKPPEVIIEGSDPTAMPWDAQVEKVDGPGKDRLLEARNEIQWQFREDMVAEDATHIWQDGGPVLFNPPQAGLFCWKTPRTLAFRPEHSWPVGKLVQVRSIRPVSAISGKSYEIRDAAYETEKLEISEARFGDSTEELIVRFNTDVHPQDARKHIKVTSPASQEPLDFEFESNSPVQTLKFHLPGNTSNTLYLQFSQHLRPSNGDVGLGEEQTQTLQSSKDLRLVRTRPVMNSYGKGEVYLKFSHNVTPADLRTYVSFVPKIPFSLLPTDSRWMGHCRLQADFVPGNNYEIRIDSGLKVDGAWPMSAPVLRNVLIPDRPVAVGFLQKGTHLTPSGQLAIEANTVNVESLQLSIHRIYPNNLVIFGMRNQDKYRGYYGYAHQGLSVPVVKEAHLPVAHAPNQAATSLIDLKQHLEPPYTGVYHVDIRSGSNSKADRKILHISDIGTTLLHSDKVLLVWANSLSTLAAIPGATVTLYSETNQALATGNTNSEGLAKIPVPSNPSETPFLLSVTKGPDTANLFLAETRIESATPTGRPYLAGRTEAFLFTDRGIYRPGETLHLKALLRNQDAQPTEPFPVELTARRPDGRIGTRLSSIPSHSGSVDFTIPFRRTDPLGKYTFELSIPGSDGSIPTLGSCTASLAEFTAAKLEVTVKKPEIDTPILPGDTLQAKASAHHLTGRPATGQPATAFASFHPTTFQHHQWKEFSFIDEELQFPAEHRKQLKVSSGHIDQDGNLQFDVDIPSIQAPSNFEAIVGVTVTDVAGRPVTNIRTYTVAAYPVFAGIRTTKEPGKWEAAAVHHNGNPAKDGTALELEIFQISRSLFLRKDDDGEYRYQSERHLERVHKTKAETIAGKTSFHAPDDLAPGNYLVRVTEPAGGSSSTTIHEVTDGESHSVTWTGDAPEKVELSFDKETYVDGDTAILRLASPFPGKALVTLQKDKLLESHIIDLGPDGTGQVLFQVNPNLFPNAWAMASVIRKASKDAPAWQPRRAFGRVALQLSPEPRKLKIRIDTPEATSPSAPLHSSVHVTDNLGNPVECELTLALVDEGILSLTRFPTPDPLKFFHAPRLPGFDLHDPYGLLLPEVDADGVQGKLAVGAGALKTPSKFLNPIEAQRFHNLALWQPAVHTGPDGKADVPWDLPEFSGKARIMVMAAADGKFGSTEQYITIKRPFTVVSGLPRFLAPGDSIRMPLRIFNDSDQSLPIQWKLVTSEGLSIGDNNQKEISENTTIQAGQSFEKVLDLSTSATPGISWIDISAQSGDETYMERIEIPVRPPHARDFKVVSGVLAKGEETTLLSAQGFLPSTTSGKLELSGAPDALLGPAMDSLLKYPYGCLEQTTSGSFPLLYASDLQETRGEAEVREYVQAGIERILGMQHPQGSFGWWPGDAQAFDWGTLYATQFLLEAKAAGYEVPQAATNRALDWILRGFQRGSKDKAHRDSFLAYALQVTALAGKVQEGWMKRYSEKLDSLQTEDKIRLALAYAYSGDRRRAAGIAKGLHLPTLHKNEIQDWRTLRSPLRSLALLLGLHVELDPGSAMTAQLVQRLAGKFQKSDIWTTQENAMVILALGKYARHLSQGSTDTSAQVTIDGERIGEKSPQQSHHFKEGELPGIFRIKNEGPGPLYYSMSTDGIPLAAPTPKSEGIAISRLMDSGIGPLQRGDVFEMEIVIDTLGNHIDHLAIQDLLPAGLEIESSEPNDSVRHKEHRDDRFLVFPKGIQGIRRYPYLVRAVTAGNYTLPAPTAVCMYDAAIQAIGETGNLTIQE